jgi:hypothetical protein
MLAALSQGGGEVTQEVAGVLCCRDSGAKHGQLPVSLEKAQQRTAVIMRIRERALSGKRTKMATRRNVRCAASYLSCIQQNMHSQMK